MTQDIDVGTRIGQIADELRAIAANGLHFATNEYDVERFHRVRDLAAWLLAEVDTRSAAEIERIFRGDLGYRTPVVAVDAAIFRDPAGLDGAAIVKDAAGFEDAAGLEGDGAGVSTSAERRILLARRSDSGEWCMPGGSADIGESPSRAAEREAFEETGLTVRARRLIGLYDNRTWRLQSQASHAYYAVFECDVLGGELTTSSETTEFRWATLDEALALPLFRSHQRKVPEAFRMHLDPAAPADFH